MVLIHSTKQMPEPTQPMEEIEHVRKELLSREFHLVENNVHLTFDIVSHVREFHHIKHFSLELESYNNQFVV